MNEQYPVGGPRKAVYSALTGRGFKMSGFGDKHWTRSDGINVNIYGSGSRLAVYRDKEKVCDGPMAESLATIDDLSGGEA